MLCPNQLCVECVKRSHLYRNDCETIDMSHQATSLKFLTLLIKIQHTGDTLSQRSIGSKSKQKIWVQSGTPPFF